MRSSEPKNHIVAVAEKPRLAMIDIAKGLGILLVVLGHNDIFFSNGPNRFGEFLGAFRLPFFFFISGVTLSIGQRAIRTVAIERADAWLKPFALAALIGAAAKILVGKMTIESLLLGLVFGTGFTLIWPAIWFLPHLWLLYVSAAVLLVYGKRLIDSWPKRIALLIFMVTAGYFLMLAFDSHAENPACKLKTVFDWSVLECGLPFSADLLMLTGFFFLLGHFLSKPVKAFRIDPTLLIAVFGGLILLHVVFGFSIDFNWRRYDDLVISTVQALCGIYVMLCLCSALARSKLVTQLFTYAGRGSLFILLFHQPIQYKINYFLGARWGDIWQAGVIAFVVSVALPLLFWEICKRSKILSLFFLPVRKKSGASAESAVSANAPSGLR